MFGHESMTDLSFFKPKGGVFSLRRFFRLSFFFFPPLLPEQKAKQELEETEGRKTTHDLQLIDVPVQHIIRFVLDLLMRAEATATAAAVAVAAASSAAAGGAIAACRQNPVDPISSDKWGENEGEVGEEDEKEVGDDGTVETDLSSSSSDAAAEKVRPVWARIEG